MPVGGTGEDRARFIDAKSPCAPHLRRAGWRIVFRCLRAATDLRPSRGSCRERARWGQAFARCSQARSPARVRKSSVARARPSGKRGVAILLNAVPASL